jgi:MtfA peptidase
MFFRSRRRKKLRAQPFPPAWEAIAEARVPIYGKLTPSDRDELHGLVQVFLDEKTFEGAKGLEITDEIRVTIAVQACLLLLHRDVDDFPRLRTILVYPSDYVAPSHRRDEAGVVHEGAEGRLGESWHHGLVVLSWDAVRRGTVDVRDGHNVVLHEFAHQLDSEDGSANGAPLLAPSPSAYAAWARVLGESYADLVETVHRDRSSVLRDYGATNPAEFFAVATEAFFERPLRLKREEPALYEQLASFYRQDPAVWGAG